MKKFALMLSLLLVMVGALVLPAAAQDDAHPLAAYFPATSPFYIESRIDDAFIADLDALIAKFATLVPTANIGSSLVEMLDEGVNNMQEGGTFATTVRPWLGDTAAIGLTEIETNMRSSNQSYLLVIEITDKAEAEDFFTRNATNSNYEISEEDGYTLFTSGGSTGTYAIFRDDVLIVTSDTTIANVGGLVDGSLSNLDAFTTAANLLPESEYGVFAYLDTPAMFRQSMETSMNLGMDEIAILDSLLNGLQPQALGLTKLGDNGLVIDVASPVNADADSLLTMSSTGPIDPTFVRHIPADSAFVIHANNLYQNYQAGMETLTAFADAMAQNPDFNAQDFQTLLRGMEFGVRGLTGMEIDEALGWMTGDYALAVALAPSFADASGVSAAANALPIDFSYVIEVTDEAAAQALFDGLNRSIGGLATNELTVAEETLDGDVPALVLTMTSRQTPFPVEILIANGNGVFAIGTRRMVEAAVNPQNGLDSNAQFTAATATVLGDSNVVLYVGANGLHPLARVMSASSNPQSTQQDGKMLKQILSLFDSLTISASVEADGSAGVSRFVWNLPE